MAVDHETWLPLAKVEAYLTLDPGDGGTLLVDVRDGVAAWIERRRRDLLDEAGTTFAADADVLLGALILVARMWSRRSSPAGVASFGEFGPSTILRYDPDLERMLGVGRYAKPMAR